MGTGDSNQNSILKGILQNGSSFNYPGAFKIYEEKKLFGMKKIEEKSLLLVEMENELETKSTKN